MANVIQETRVVTPGLGRSFRWIPAILGMIGAAALIVGLANISQVEQPTINASTLTADSYRQFAEAMNLVQTAAAGAVTADSYDRFAEAMTVVPPATAGAITADSYDRFAGAMDLVQRAAAGAVTADSYDRFAEAMTTTPSP